MCWGTRRPVFLLLKKGEGFMTCERDTKNYKTRQKALIWQDLKKD